MMIATSDGCVIAASWDIGARRLKLPLATKKRTTTMTMSDRNKKSGLDRSSSIAFDGCGAAAYAISIHIALYLLAKIKQAAN
jgi:hypothetical protein